MSETRQKKRFFSIAKLMVILTVVLIVLIALLYYCPSLMFNSFSSLVDQVRLQAGSEESLSFKEGFCGGTVNIVVLGFDRTASRDEYYEIYRPDTIMIAVFDFQNTSLSLLSIPRDSYVHIHGTDIYDKINHSFMHGYRRAAEGDEDTAGLNTTILTVSELLGGIPIHGYLKIDMDGTAAVIDSIGGVYFDVEEEIRSRYKPDVIQVEKGYQLLDDRKFLNFVRNRSDYLGGERGRTERQQQVVVAMFDQLVRPRGIFKVPSFLSAVRSNSESDLNLLQIVTLGLFSTRVNLNEVITHVFSGSGKLSYRDGLNIYYLVIDENERASVIKDVFGIEAEKRLMPVLPGPVTAEPEIDIEQEEEPAPEIKPEPEPEPEPDNETETNDNEETEDDELDPEHED